VLELLGKFFEAAPQGEWVPEDYTSDGEITAEDIPFEPGSLEAQKAWIKIEAIAHSPASISKAKALGYEDARGWYGDGPLVPGAGPGHRDYQFLIDKLVYKYGYDPAIAQKVAGKAKWITT
jgi:L-rhamnose isomerase